METTTDWATNENLVAHNLDEYPDWSVLPVLKAALAANDANHERMKSVGEAQSVLTYLRDFRTIRLDIGQRTGNTFAIVSLAQPDDVVVVRDMDRAANYDIKADVLTERLLAGQTPTRYRTIWVDTATWDLTPAELRQLYEALGRDIHQRFVLLG